MEPAACLRSGATLLILVSLGGVLYISDVVLILNARSNCVNQLSCDPIVTALVIAAEQLLNAFADDIGSEPICIR